MRIGQNPARRSIAAYTPARLGVASLVYIPILEGYFADLLPVVELHLRSLRQNTAEEFDLLVFDNGSCDTVKDCLLEWQKQGLIDWLVTSQHNVGKTGALNWMIAAMPNELLVYSDSDVLFRAGWLEQSLAILDAFPMAGMITAQPDFLPLVDGKMKAHLQLDPAEFETGQVLPSQRAVDEYVRGLGDKPKTRERVTGKPIPVVTQRASGCQAVIGATHMQFLARREVLQQALPLPATLGLSPEEDQVLDARVDERGYLHLSTLEPYVYHMGNQLDEIALAETISSLAGGSMGEAENPPLPPLRTPLREREARGGKNRRSRSSLAPLSLPSGSAKREGGQGGILRPLGWRIFAKLVRSPLLRGFFTRLYNRLFQIYSQ